MKKIFYLLPVFLLSLTSCQGEKITFEQALKEINDCEVDLNKYDKVSSKLKIEALEYQDPTMYIKLSQFEQDTTSIGGVSATQGKDLVETTKLNAGHIYLVQGDKISVNIRNAYYGTYLKDGNMYMDISNVGMYQLMSKSIPELEEVGAGRYYQPVDFSGIEFPLMTEDTVKQSQETLDQLLELIKSEENDSETISLEECAEVYTSNHHRNFDISLKYGLDDIENEINRHALDVHLVINDGLIKSGDVMLDFKELGFDYSKILTCKLSFEYTYGKKVREQPLENYQDYELLPGKTIFGGTEE